jgi:glycosyltransferase involved in cell wall biosynthesis
MIRHTSFSVPTCNHFSAVAEALVEPSDRLKEMKIAFLLDGIYRYASGSPRARGGAERDLWLLGAALARFGWAVKVAVRDDINPNCRTWIQGVEFIGIGRGRVLLEWYRFLSSERPDWLFWRCADPRLGALVEIAAWAGVRTIFSVGCDLDVEPRHAPLYCPRWWPLYAWGLSRTHRIFVQHQDQLCGLRPEWRSKASILPKVCILPGIVGDAMTLKPHSERTKYVIWAGSLMQLKRPDLLIEIARKLPAIRFVVCGGPSTLMSAPDYSGRIIDELGRTANVEYLGQVPPEKAHKLIAEAALLLSTSDTEGFPNTFVQAWSNGTPVVSLKVDPDHNIQRLGLGTVSGNTEGAALDIAALIDSANRREAIGRRARAFIIENHSAATVVGRFERALHHAL